VNLFSVKTAYTYRVNIPYLMSAARISLFAAMMQRSFQLPPKRCDYRQSGAITAKAVRLPPKRCDYRDESAVIRLPMMVRASVAEKTIWIRIGAAVQVFDTQIL
jgi:hypothetical protein